MQGVDGISSSGKWHTGESGNHTVDVLLDEQVGTIDTPFVPVVIIGPTQHIAEVAISKGADRASGIYLRIRCL